MFNDIEILHSLDQNVGKLANKHIFLDIMHTVQTKPLSIYFIEAFIDRKKEEGGAKLYKIMVDSNLP